MPMNAAKLLLLNVLGGSAVDDSDDELNTPVAFTVTTSSPSITFYITTLLSSVQTTVYWGDGSKTTYSANDYSAKSHEYASAGEWAVRISSPEAIQNFYLDGNSNRKVTINSADLVDWRPTSFTLVANSPAHSNFDGVFDSADLVDWRPDTFRLDVMRAPFGGTLDSADFADWLPGVFSLDDLSDSFGGTLNSVDFAGYGGNTFRLRSLPSTFGGVINSADFAGMDSYYISHFELNNLPDTFSGTLDSADMGIWSIGTLILNLPSTFDGTLNSSDLTSLAPEVFEAVALPSGFSGAIDFADFAGWNPFTFLLPELPVSVPVAIADTDLSGWTNLYDFDLADNALTTAQVDAVLLGLYTAAQSRTGTGGSMNLSGSNAAPSGTYAAECPPTTGLGAKHGLLNDGCSTISGMVWDDITTTP